MTRLDYSTQLMRVAELISQMETAFVERDFEQLAELGNRLATDSIIAEALRRDAGEDGAAESSGEPRRIRAA